MELTAEQEALWPLAKAAYEGYSQATGGKSAITGDKLPSWSELPSSVRNAWWSAARAMKAALK